MSSAGVSDGVFSETMSATAEIQDIANQVRAEFEKQAHMTCVFFKAILYRYQHVYQPSRGINYLIKVQVSDNAYVHLKVFRGPISEDKDPELINFQTGKTKGDPLNDF